MQKQKLANLNIPETTRKDIKGKDDETSKSIKSKTPTNIN